MRRRRSGERLRQLEPPSATLDSLSGKHARDLSWGGSAQRNGGGPMNQNTARTWLVNVSLVVTGAFVIFMTLGPAIGYPLEFQQALRLTEVVIPVFLGYLGSA